MATLSTTATALSGGTNATAAVTARFLVAVTGPWVTGDRITLTLTNVLTALTATVGSGTVTGLQPVYAFTYKKKVYLLAGSVLYFCDEDSPTVWNNPLTLGNSFIEMANNYGTTEDLKGLAPFQGRLSVSSRRTTQMWQVDPDPVNYQQLQVLDNVGTPAPATVRAVGDMDVYLLMDSGFRSIRVRDASNNGILADIGTPVDVLVQALLATLTPAELAGAVGTVDPASNRYWCFVPGHNGAEGVIYVFGSFVTSGVAAWSTYRPTYQVAQTIMANYGPTPISIASVIGTRYVYSPGINDRTATCGTTVLTAGGSFIASATTIQLQGVAMLAPAANVISATTIFAPEFFAVINGRIYARSGKTAFLYGGADNQTYENCGMQGDTPFMAAGKTATRKTYHGLDAVCEGKWDVALGANIANADDVRTIYKNTGPSMARGLALAGKQGTHFKLRMIEDGDGYARFSGGIVHFNEADDKG